MDDDRPHLGDVRPDRPLRVAALVKQVPLAEALELRPDGRLRREATPLEMNPYCRRAVSKGTELARTSGGTCAVLTLGPPAAEEVLREAVAWGADGAVHLTDPAFAGSDTLATARALAAALRREGPFDLVLVGRNSTDGDTGQVGPEVAQLLDLPFAAGARRMGFAAGSLLLDLEQDDGFETVEVDLPAVVSVAERLIEPAKVDPEGRRAVPDDRIRRLAACDLGEGPWGDAGSPTTVGAVRLLPHQRAGKVLGGSLVDQVVEAVQLLSARGALHGHQPVEGTGQLAEEAERSWSSAVAEPITAPLPSPGPNRRSPADTAEVPPSLVVVAESGRPRLTAELLGAAGQLADEVGGRVTVLAPPLEPRFDDDRLAADLGAAGADEVLRLDVAQPEGHRSGIDGGAPALAAEDVAGALTEWARARRPWVVLAPSTAFGREVAARAAAALGAGLVGDAVGVAVVDGRLVAAKPAFSGALVADITCSSPIQLVTVRPGVLTPSHARPRRAAIAHRAVAPRGRVRSRSVRRDDDVEVLARADVVIGVGTLAFSMQDILLEPYGGQVLHLSVGTTTSLTAMLAAGAGFAFLLAGRRLAKGGDAWRIAASGVMVGLVAFSLVIAAAPLATPALFAAGVGLIGFGGGMFLIGTLADAMTRVVGGMSGLALGAWGAVQALAAGIAIALAGAIRDYAAGLAATHALGPAFSGTAAGYATVYHIEIVLLFVTLALIGKLVRRENAPSAPLPFFARPSHGPDLGTTR